MAKANKEKPAIPADLNGWPADRIWIPQPSTCKKCGGPIPRTKMRGAAFGGHGRPREFCGDVCRQRWSRANRR